jgi:hypothetical protein
LINAVLHIFTSTEHYKFLKRELLVVLHLIAHLDKTRDLLTYQETVEMIQAAHQVDQTTDSLLNTQNLHGPMETKSGSLRTTIMITTQWDSEDTGHELDHT